MTISDYYNGLTDAEKKEFRKKVLQTTEMSQSAFYFKLRNNSWTKSEKTVLIPFIPGDEEID